MFQFIYYMFCILLLCDISLQQNYVVPEATIELLYPKGFSISIPDEPGISLFAFHGQLNKEFDGREGGFYSRDITKSKNGKWTFTDKETRFKIGDTIHYWLYVIYSDGRSNLGYESDFQSYTVRECPRNEADTSGICNGVDQNEYAIPDARVELLQPRGFKVSIPDHEGIQLFAFHGNINREFNGREAGQFAKDITRPTDGRWTFIDRNTRLKPGDILYFWLYVVHRRAGGNDLAQIKEDLSFVVSGTVDQPTSTRPPQEPCRKSETSWNGNPTCSGQLLFHEDFESLNSNNWTKEIRYADDTDYEFVIYEEFDGNLNIRNGELYIKPILADDIFGEGFIYSSRGYDLGSRCTSKIAYDCKRKLVGGYALPPVFSGKITSTAFFKYGRIDIRAKLPKGDWIYPEFFLTPRLYEFGRNNYDSGQIRIAFTGGNKNLNNEIQGSVLLGTSPYARMFNIKRFIEPEGWSNNYHIYSTIWKPVTGDTNEGLFKFRGKLKGKLEDNERADINGIVTTARYGKWIYEDPNLELKIGDKIDYSISLTSTSGIAGLTNIATAEWEVTKYDNRRRCAEPITVAIGIENDFCNGNLIFEDDFNQASINRNKWNVQQYIPSITDDDHYEFVSYQDKMENLFLRNSILYLKPKSAINRDGVLGTLDLTEECTRRKQISCNLAQIGGNILPPIVSAKILSRVAFKYGKIEIKAKVPIGDWIYPQIELIPKGKLPAYPRILLVYTRGNLNLTLDNGEDIGNTLLLGGPVNSPGELGNSKNLQNIRLPTSLGKEMRTYTVQWSPYGIEFKVENETYGSIASRDYPGLNTECQIALGVGVGGHYDFPDSTKSGNYAKPWKNFEPLYLKHFYDGRSFWEKTWHDDDVALQVDSVKVWALNTDQECEPSKTLYANGQHPCKGEIIFEDNFTDNSFNEDNWLIENYIPTYNGGPDYEFVAYERNNKTLWLNESKLFINPLASNTENDVKGILDLGDKCTSITTKQCKVEQQEASILPPVKSARISTKLNFTYGKIEIKAKLPLGDWIYPQIQLIPRDQSKIDTRIWIAYSRGNSYYIGPDGDIGSTELFSGLVYGAEEPERSRLTIKRKSFIPYGEEMHTYALIWEPEKITVMFDNETYGSYMIDPTDSRFKELQSTEFYLAIGVGVGGINDFPDKYTSNNPKPWTNDMPTRVKAFFDARNMWLPTWRQQRTRLEVDSVKILAL